jgi:hypothetical protein
VADDPDGTWGTNVIKTLTNGSFRHAPSDQHPQGHATDIQIERRSNKSAPVP